MGGIEIPTVVRNEEVLLPVKDLFDFLRIKCSLSQNLDSVSGFLTSPQLTYLIDYKKNIVLFQGKQFAIKKDDLIRTETNLYLHSRYFGEIFGLDCKFDMRNLIVQLTTKLELPALREMRIEQMRKNINRMKGEVKADSIIRKSRPIFHFGMADWSVVSTQNVGQSTDTRLNLALGSVLAGGEANLFLNYATNEKFDEKQQQYYLKFVNNDRNYLRQTILGKITTDATSSLYDPVVGIRLSNTPTTYRQAFGTYPLSDYTNPGWMVELYVNNVLVDYVKADASGFFTFQVPLVYGNSLVKLKYYGPWGEERAKEQTIVVPFSFLPPKEFNYTINAGVVENGKGTIYSRGSMNYGVNKSITISAGVEYLSSITTGNAMPFLTLATRPLSNMLLSGEVTYGVRGKGILSYMFPKNIQLELNYSKYVSGQQAITTNYLEERKVIFSLPLRSKKLPLYNRMTYDQILLPGTRYATAEWLISGAVFGVNTNLTNYAMFSPHSQPYAYTDLSMSFGMRGGLTVIPQIQYEYSSGKLISAKGAIEKYLFNNGFISFSYENNFKSNRQVIQLGLRYDLPFAQTGFTARQANNTTTLLELARGSLLADNKSNYIGANNRANVGKGGIVFAPFLDINCNNRRDSGEPKAYGLNIRISGGNAVKNDKDSTIRVTDLEPYAYYLVELDPNSFDNVAWKLLKKTLKIMVDPNQLKRVEVPVTVVGEVSGTINKISENEPQGIGRIILNIFSPSGVFIGKTMTEQDGYFSYLGLVPGRYYAQVDTVQLRKLHFVSEPDTLHFSIKRSRDGDIVEGIDFTLKSTLPETIGLTSETADKVETDKVTANKTEVKKIVADKVVADNVTEDKVAANRTEVKKIAIDKIEEKDKEIFVPPQNIPTQSSAHNVDQVFLQVGAFKGRNNAKRMADELSATIHYPTVVAEEDGWFKVRFGAFTNKEEAKLCKKTIVANGILAENLIKEIKLSKTEKNQQRPVQPIAQPITTERPITGQPAKEKTVIAVTKEAAPLQDIVIKTDNILKRHYFVQIGAFINPKNATRLIKKISHLIPHSVGIVFREQYYKVRYGPFETQDELNNCIQLVDKAGITSKELLVIDYEEIGSTPAADQPHLLDGYHVQVGTFSDKTNAMHYFQKMSAEYPYPIHIIEIGGYYKVRFGPFKSFSDTKKCRKALSKSSVDYFMQRNTVKYF